MAGKYKDVEFSLLKPDGTRVKCYGAYLISDNGFLQSSVFIDPFKARFSQAEIFWSEWIESVRKDVECVFGILKARFRILLLRMGFHDATTIRDVFLTCCILHNMINMYNDAIANPIYEIDPNISEDIFMARERSIHGSWEDFIKTYNISVSTHNLKLKDLVASESTLVNQNGSREDNHLPLTLFRSQLSQPPPPLDDDNSVEDTEAHVEDPGLLSDEITLQPPLLEVHEEWSLAMYPPAQAALNKSIQAKKLRMGQQLKAAKNLFIGTEEELNESTHHLLQQVVPDTNLEQINNSPALIGMINSLPHNPLIPLPQISLPTPIRTLKGVKGHLAILSIEEINRQLHALPIGPYPLRHYDGYGDYDALRDALVVSSLQQYNMGLVIRPIRFGKRTALPVFIERINFDLQTCLYRFKSSFKGIIYIIYFLTYNP